MRIIIDTELERIIVPDNFFTLDPTKHGATSTAWSPISKKTTDGVLQEAQLCVDCKQPAVTRPVAFVNNIDTIRVNSSNVKENVRVPIGYIVNPDPSNTDYTE